MVGRGVSGGWPVGNEISTMKPVDLLWPPTDTSRTCQSCIYANPKLTRGALIGSPNRVVSQLSLLLFFFGNLFWPRRSKFAQYLFKLNQEGVLIACRPIWGPQQREFLLCFPFFCSYLEKRKANCFYFLTSLSQRNHSDTRQQRIRYVSACACLEDEYVEFWLLESKKTLHSGGECGVHMRRSRMRLRPSDLTPLHWSHWEHWPRSPHCFQSINIDRLAMSGLFCDVKPNLLISYKDTITFNVSPNAVSAKARTLSRKKTSREKKKKKAFYVRQYGGQSKILV